MRFDLIALGETMLALAPPAGRSVRDAAYLLIDHAGAESNTCVGLARLGFHVAWVSRLGADAAGDRIVEALRAEGPGSIDVRWVRRDESRPTGLMIKEPGTGVRYYRAGSAASEIGPEDLEDVPVAEARAVLVTGVTALIGPRPHAAGLTLFTARGAPTTFTARGAPPPLAAAPLRIFDPNLRAGLWGSDRRAELVRPFIDTCDLLLAGAQELAEILGAGDAETLARRASERGPQEIVVRSVESIGALSEGVWRELDITRDAAVDPIGAGDAFNAGYVATRLRGGTIDDALGAGARCGAAVTTAVSDTSGFPRSLG